MDELLFLRANLNNYTVVHTRNCRNCKLLYETICLMFSETRGSLASVFYTFAKIRSIDCSFSRCFSIELGMMVRHLTFRYKEITDSGWKQSINVIYSTLAFQ